MSGLAFPFVQIAVLFGALKFTSQYIGMCVFYLWFLAWNCSIFLPSAPSVPPSFAPSFPLLLPSSLPPLLPPVRATLGLLVCFSFIAFRRAVHRKLGAPVSIFLTLITVSQFHFLFYASRPLPNMFALVLGELRTSICMTLLILLLSSTSPPPSPHLTLLILHLPSSSSHLSSSTSPPSSPFSSSTSPPLLLLLSPLILHLSSSSSHLSSSTSPPPPLTSHPPPPLLLPHPSHPLPPLLPLISPELLISHLACPPRFSSSPALLAFRFWLLQHHGRFIWASGAAIVLFRSELSILLGFILFLEIGSYRLGVWRAMRHIIIAGALWLSTSRNCLPMSMQHLQSTTPLLFPFLLPSPDLRPRTSLSVSIFLSLLYLLLFFPPSPPPPSFPPLPSSSLISSPPLRSPRFNSACGLTVLGEVVVARGGSPVVQYCGKQEPPLGGILIGHLNHMTLVYSTLSNLVDSK